MVMMRGALHKDIYESILPSRDQLAGQQASSQSVHEAI
jgi:hypothetical protein